MLRRRAKSQACLGSRFDTQPLHLGFHILQRSSLLGLRKSFCQGRCKLGTPQRASHTHLGVSGEKIDLGVQLHEVVDVCVVHLRKQSVA